MIIPIHILTGFLGSGKTTFLKKLLDSDDGKETLIIVNELGEVGIDNALIDPIHENTYLLSNGCICCTVLTDMKETLLNVYQLREEKGIPYFSRIIIETTGLANPASLLNTILQDIHLKGIYSIDGVTTVVDAENIFSSNQSIPEWAVQVTAADQLYISKKDLVSQATLLRVSETLEKFNKSALINGQNLTLVTINALFAQRRTVKEKAGYLFFNVLELQQHQDIKTFVISQKQPIHWIGFGIWLNLLLKKYGENILRVKGIFKIEESDEPLLIQGVQHCIYPPEHLDAWPWEEESKIVFIVRGLDSDIIKRSFEIFMRLT